MFIYQIVLKYAIWIMYLNIILQNNSLMIINLVSNVQSSNIL